MLKLFINKSLEISVNLKVKIEMGKLQSGKLSEKPKCFFLDKSNFLKHPTPRIHNQGFYTR